MTITAKAVTTNIPELSLDNGLTRIPGKWIPGNRSDIREGDYIHDPSWFGGTYHVHSIEERTIRSDGTSPYSLLYSETIQSTDNGKPDYSRRGEMFQKAIYFHTVFFIWVPNDSTD